MNMKVKKSCYIFDKDLPPDWVKVYSKSKNGIYFFNPKTGKSQWRTPSFSLSTSTSSTSSSSTELSSKENANKKGNQALKVGKSSNVEKQSPTMGSRSLRNNPSKNEHKHYDKNNVAKNSNSQSGQKAQSRLINLRNQLELAKQIRNEKIKKTIRNHTNAIPETKIRPTQNESKTKTTATTTTTTTTTSSIDNNEYSTTKKRKIHDTGSMPIKDTSINNLKKLKTNIENQEQLVPLDNNKHQKSSATSTTQMKVGNKFTISHLQKITAVSIPKINYNLISFNDNSNNNNRSSTITTNRGSSANNLRLNSFQIPKISAQNRLQNFREKLALEQEKTNASEQVAQKIDHPLITNQPTIITTDNDNYDIDDVVMAEDFSFQDSSNHQEEEDDESMDWEDIPEEIVIQEVHKFRSHNNDNFQIQKATEQFELHNDVQLGLNNNQIKNYNNNEFFIVIDTNILLKTNGNYKQLEIMMGNILKASSNIVIIIPFMVLNELDKLKYDPSISKLARLAVRFLNVQFQNDQHRIRGQSAIDNNKKFIDITNADDNILNCCIQLKYNNNNVILLSNDINLRNKSLASSIKSFSYEDFSNNNNFFLT